MPVDWSLPVVWARDTAVCQDCGERVCEVCRLHYYDCKHPGPSSVPEEGDLNAHLYQEEAVN